MYDGTGWGDLDDRDNRGVPSHPLSVCLMIVGKLKSPDFKKKENYTSVVKTN